jgi:hypothetical protein
MATLRFVAAEELVLFAAGAIGALEAADEQDRDTQRNQDGQHTCV